MLSWTGSKLLRVFQYPHFGQLAGEHRVGAMRVRLDEGTVHCQILYPIERPRAHGGCMGRGGGLAPPAKYWRPEAIEGIAHYSKMPAALFADVLGCPHPCAFGRPVKKAPPESPWPIVIFSHGLGGSADMYLQFCMHLASLGYIVFALEHEDRSGCHATTAAGEVLRYRSPPADFVYTRESVVAFRRPFLTKRVAEVEAVLAALSRKAAPPAAVAALLAEADASGPPALIGHSFGATTMMLVCQRLQAINPRVAVLLDPWSFAASEAECERGVPQPVGCVMSEAWTANKELFAVKAMLRRCPHLLATLCARGSRHQSISDTATWAPGLMAVKMGARGEREDAHATRRAMAEACHVLIQRTLLHASPAASPSMEAELLESLCSESRKVLRPFVPAVDMEMRAST